mgnify:CR=1 FL=1
MIIYNVTISIDAGESENWLSWMRTKHIPDVLNTGCFLEAKLSKIIGESYFNLEKYEDAISYLRVYRGKKGKWNNTDYYQLGYAYFKQNDFENAVNNFNKIIKLVNVFSNVHVI